MSIPCLYRNRSTAEQTYRFQGTAERGRQNCCQTAVRTALSLAASKSAANRCRCYSHPERALYNPETAPTPELSVGGTRSKSSPIFRDDISRSLNTKRKNSSSGLSKRIILARREAVCGSCAGDSMVLQSSAQYFIPRTTGLLLKHPTSTFKDTTRGAESHCVGGHRGRTFCIK